MMTLQRFNVRVYGICIDKNLGLLVTDERIHGLSLTKFPGGGLEFGEGTIDCLKREFMEETGQAVRVLNHFYTTDWFVPSAFNSESQIISIYYEVEFESTPGFQIREKKYDFPAGKEDALEFRWLKPSKWDPAEFTFPVDKKVASLLKSRIADN